MSRKANINDPEMKFLYKFNNLGWEASLFPNGGYTTPDLILSYNNKEYGYIYLKTNLSRMPINTKKELMDKVNEYINKKDKIFIFSDGIIYDLFLKGKPYASLTMPPRPEEVDILLGGK